MSRARPGPDPAGCGGRGILRGWFSLGHSCPTCGLVLERGESEDYWIGGYTVNLVAAELLGIGAIIAFFPFSRTLWLASDLLFRPSEKGDVSA